MSTFAHIVSVEARTRLSYRGAFWFNAAFGFMSDFGVVFFVWTAMFAESGHAEIGGRTLSATINYYLLVALLGRMVRGDRFEGQISADIYEGGLNRYLVFPYSYFRFKYAQRLGQMAPEFLKSVVFGVLAISFVSFESAAFTVGSVIMGLGAVFVANLVFFLIMTIVHQVAFWADNVWSLDVAVWFVASLLGGWMLPLSVFSEPVRAWLEVLPFRFLYDFPVRVLMGEIGAVEWARGIVVVAVWCIALALVSRWVWRRGQRRYTGVGI